MGCACSRGRKAAAPQGSSFTYLYFAPGASTSDNASAQTFANPLEAKRALRRAGGGTIKRVTVPA